MKISFHFLAYSKIFNPLSIVFLLGLSIDICYLPSRSHIFHLLLILETIMIATMAKYVILLNQLLFLCKFLDFRSFWNCHIYIYTAYYSILSSLTLFLVIHISADDSILCFQNVVSKHNSSGIHHEDCMRECSEDEIALEYTLNKGLDSFYYWRLEDQDNLLLQECNPCEYPESGQVHLHKCLPKKNCSTFLIADNFQNVRADQDPRAAKYEVKVESFLFSGSNFAFETFHVGKCALPCNQEDQLFEFFIFSNNQQRKDIEMAWTLQDVSDDMESAITVNEGIIKSESEVNSLSHIAQCVPRNRCYLFTFGVPKHIPGLIENEMRSIALDGIIYRRGQYFFWDRDNTLSEATFLGDCVQSSQCQDDESLFELSLIITNEKFILALLLRCHSLVSKCST